MRKNGARGHAHCCATLRDRGTVDAVSKASVAGVLTISAFVDSVRLFVPRPVLRHILEMVLLPLGPGSGLPKQSKRLLVDCQKVLGATAFCERGR